MRKFTPEILSPAGNLEKLKVAILYGADAVYFSGQKYGMRAGADNFTSADIIEGVKFAKSHGAKTYITMNSFFHDEDFKVLDKELKFLEQAGIDALIVSDPGVISFIKKHSNLAVHLSTQASCLNLPAARCWKSLGTERLVMGRELSIAEASEIKKSAQIEVELFIHGAMCMAYSGNCVISNFTAGRDSNRGGCIQSCRYQYDQKPLKNGLNVLNTTTTCSSNATASSHFISSKDMNGVRLVPNFISGEIDSLKIEGRMKSLFYVASVTKAYRQAIDLCLENKLDANALNLLEAELASIPHRDYFEASLLTEAPQDSSYQHRNEVVRKGGHKFLGLVVDANSDFLAVKANTPVKSGDEIQFLPFKGPAIKVKSTKLYSASKELITSPKQDCIVFVPKELIACELPQYTVVRSSENIVN